MSLATGDYLINNSRCRHNGDNVNEDGYNGYRQCDLSAHQSAIRLLAFEAHPDSRCPTDQIRFRHKAQ